MIHVRNSRRTFIRRRPYALHVYACARALVCACVCVPVPVCLCVCVCVWVITLSSIIRLYIRVYFTFRSARFPSSSPFPRSRALFFPILFRHRLCAGCMTGASVHRRAIGVHFGRMTGVGNLPPGENVSLLQWSIKTIRKTRLPADRRGQGSFWSSRFVRVSNSFNFIY